jgi:hypothetical protein
MSGDEWEWVDLPLANQGGVWRQVRPKKPELNYNPPKLITQLTPAQEATLAKLRRKWRNYTLSNTPIDRSLVSIMICAAYKGVAHTQYTRDLVEKPKILFFDTPDAACQELLKQWMLQKQRDEHKREKRIVVERKIWNGILRHRGIPEEIDPVLRQRHYDQPPGFTWSQIWERMEQKLYEDYAANYWGKPCDSVHYLLGENRVRARMKTDLLLPDAWADHCSWSEFCITTLNYHFNVGPWQALQDVVRNCGWFFPFDEVCIVCDRTWL